MRGPNAVQKRFHDEALVTVVDDPAGDSSFWTCETFRAVVCLSMLHHLRTTSTESYLAWRLGRAELFRGAPPRRFMLRRVDDEASPFDMAEYGVVRLGLDRDALTSTLGIEATRRLGDGGGGAER